MSSHASGTFEMSPAGPFEAGSYTTLRFVYTVGAAGLRAGGRVRIGTPNQGWGEPSVLCPNPIGEVVSGKERRHNPWKPLNTTFELKTATNAWVRMWTEERGAYLLKSVADKPGWEWTKTAVHWRWWLNADVELADLEPGDQLIVTYGNTEEHPFGVRVQPFPEERTRPFICVVDAAGDGELREVTGSPMPVTVHSGPPETVVAVAPSLVSPGEAFAMRAAVLDRNLVHPAEPYRGAVTFIALDDGVTVPAASPARDGDTYVLQDVKATAGPVARVEVITDVGTKAANPSAVIPERQENLYWGDLHAQCMYHQWKALEQRGDSNRTPAELHQYARECSLLDFVACTNSGCPNPNNPGWEATQQAAIDAYEPGRYVAFKGWECGLGVQGDRCLIYREADVEPNFVIPRAGDRDPSHAHALLRFCRESPYHIITSNHSFMKYLDWSVFDPDIDRIIEVYSCWGSYESRDDNPLNSKRRPRQQSAMYAFSLGYTPGVVAAGDSHVGYPGRSLMNADPYLCQNWKAGLAAVFAPKLTRAAIWDALYSRYCYGTTGARIVLQFRINGERMGSVIECDDDAEDMHRRKLEVAVHGTDLIRRVDIVKNNGLIHRVCPREDHATFEVIDELEATPTTRDWYYVRVFQADGNAAWSSPIWIGPAGVCTPSSSLGE